MSLVRGLVALALVSVALVLQVTLFPHLAWAGIVPNLVLLVVVASALARGAQFAAVLGFAAGLLLDLAPPADHVAGRWALAFVLVGYLAGRVRQDVRPSVTSVIAMVAGSSFVGTSVYALSGVLLRDPSIDFGEFAQVIGISVGYDILLTPLVMPWLISLFWRLEPDRALA
jgi:rod shape-determining protein MreD